MKRGEVEERMRRRVNKREQEEERKKRGEECAECELCTSESQRGEKFPPADQTSCTHHRSIQKSRNV